MSRRLSIFVVALAILPSTSCRHFERNPEARPPRDLPSEWLVALRPRYDAFNLVLTPSEETASYRRFTLRFSTFSEAEGDFKVVEGHYYQSLEVPEGGRGPLLLVSPILAGPADNYLSCRIFSRWACARGMSAFYLHQPARILSSSRDARALELFFREDVRDNLQALDLLSKRPEVDPSRLGSFGISLGAIKNVILIGVEPRLRANVLCLAGCDLAGILMASREGAVERYVEKRLLRESIGRDELAADLRNNIDWAPGALAEAVASERVLLFLGSLDDKVPYENGLLLREKLGRPETYVVPLGHYTGILAAPYAARRGFDFMERRFAR